MSTPDIEFVNLGIKIEKLFQGFPLFGKFYIAAYGICIALGVLSGAAVAFAGGKRNRENPDLYTDFALIGVVLSLIGARIYYVVFEWDYYKDNLMQIFNFRAGGLAIYGGVITAVISAIVFTKIKKMNFFRMADNAVPGLILGQAIGRWGNFFNCECFGGYTNNLFAMRIREDMLRSDMINEKIMKAQVSVFGETYYQVHPTFLYEFLWNIASFALMMVFHFSKWKKNDGEVLALYFICYGSGRFWIESLRTDQLLIPGTTIPVSMVVSAVLVVLGIGILVWRRFYAKNTLTALNSVLVRDKVFFIGGAPNVEPAAPEAEADASAVNDTGKKSSSKKKNDPSEENDSSAGQKNAAELAEEATALEKEMKAAGSGTAGERSPGEPAPWRKKKRR
ncbi:MAG: prolipoprotein diacylglyceryl transferase [Lachnospiraceae bacterium]|nr:prolipoprotein diacylglyceryl transferase [Lachnospiraceae bacterium]